MRAYPTPDQEAIVRRIALEEGVDPRLLMSVWEQESSKSVDPAMTGPVLPEGHKYAGHYGRGPFQIMSFHGPIASDFEGQARWAAKHLKQRGVRGYYGTGKPPPGFPTTDQYEQQVMARVPGAGMLAQAGMPDVPQGLGRQPQGPGFQQAPRAPEVQEMPQQAPMDGLLTNPYLLLGASILAANDSKNTAQVLGRGLLGGAMANDRAEQSRSIREYRQQQAQMLRMKEEAALRQQQAWDALMSGQGGGGGQLGGGAIGGLAQYAVASQDPDLLAKVMGLQMEAQKALLPYGAVTLADQQRIEIDRQRQALQEREMADKGITPLGVPQGALVGTPGMAPIDRRFVQREAPLKTMDFLLTERKSGKVSSALSTLEATGAAMRALDEGMFTGPYAESKAGLAKYLGAYTGERENTEQYIAATAELARQALQQIGGNDSNTDLLFSRATTGGDITMQAKSLKKLMEITDRKSRTYLQDYNRFAERVPETERDAYKVEIPPPYTTKAKELPKEVTLQDVSETAKALGKSEAEVIKMFRAKGVGIRY